MAARHGYATADIAANYVRQSIVLQTTAAYFDRKAQRDTVAPRSNSKPAARRRVEGLAEGHDRPLGGDQAIFATELRETSLNQARRQVTVRRAELLEIMGLSPLRR